MGRIVNCFYCKEAVDRDCTVRFEDKNFHEECLKEYQDKREIYKYVARLFKFKSETRPGPLIISQLKTFKEKYPHYTYQGILNALIYFFDIKKNSTAKSKESIGIVPYVYDEAQEYFRRLENKKEEIAEVIEKQLAEKPVVLKIKKVEEKKEKKLYNLEEL